MIYKGGMAVKRGHIWPWAIPGLAALALRLSPALALAWARGVSRPLLRAMNRGTGRLPFPLAEPLALLLAAALLGASARRLRRGRWRDALRAFLLPALALLSAYALLWLPNGFSEAASRPVSPDPGRLEALCGALVDALNADAAEPPAPADALATAPAAAGLPGARAKAARYPEWMRAKRVAGLFVPWTGEVLVDGGAAPALIPYTAVHELMHLSGVADEGMANIAAWRRCMDAGGGFALSARLWALRYAAGLLAGADARAPERLEARMSPAALALWRASGGPIAPRSAGGSYHALVSWLSRQPLHTSTQP